MKIRAKSDLEIRKDLEMIHDNQKMRIFWEDLYWVLDEKSYPMYLKKNKKFTKETIVQEKNWILTIRINRNKINTIHQINRTISTAANTIIQFWPYKEHLYKHHILKDPKIKDLQIVIDEKNCVAKIPEWDKKNLLEYFKNKNEQENFDCKSFIYMIKNIKEENKEASDITKNWTLKRKQESALEIGECICLFEHSSKDDSLYYGIKHFAYYIWWWLFISKYGKKWCVHISTLEEMHTFYWTKDFVSMNPK